MTVTQIDAELELWASKLRAAELSGSRIGVQIAQRRLDWLLDRKLEHPPEREMIAS